MPVFLVYNYWLETNAMHYQYQFQFYLVSTEDKTAECWQQNGACLLQSSRRCYVSTSCSFLLFDVNDELFTRKTARIFRHARCRISTLQVTLSTSWLCHLHWSISRPSRSNIPKAKAEVLSTTVTSNCSTTGL